MTGPRLEVLAGRTVEQRAPNSCFAQGRGRRSGTRGACVGLGRRARHRDSRGLPCPLRSLPGSLPANAPRWLCRAIAINCSPFSRLAKGRLVGRRHECQATESRRAPGVCGGGASLGGVVLADLLGDGTLATLAATTAADGHARLVAYGPAHQVLWGHDFAISPRGRGVEYRRADALVRRPIHGPPPR